MRNRKMKDSYSYERVRVLIRFSRNIRQYTRMRLFQISFCFIFEPSGDPSVI